MRKAIICLGFIAAVALGTPTKAAVMVVDPAVGASGYFQWYETDNISHFDGAHNLSITVGPGGGLVDILVRSEPTDGALPDLASLVSTSSIADAVSEFELDVDTLGGAVPWTSEGYDSTGAWEGQAIKLLLKEGENLVHFHCTVNCEDSGEAFYSISAVSPVPLPAVVWMFISSLIGLIGFGYFTRSQKRPVS